MARAVPRALHRQGDVRDVLASAGGAVHADNRGVVAIMAALLMPILIAALALVDVAYWRYRVDQLQLAADATAIATILDIQGSGCSTASTAYLCSSAVLQADALAEAQKNGCGSNCSISRFTWPYGGSYAAVEVVLQDPSAPRFFSSIYDSSSKVLTGRAVGNSAAPPPSSTGTLSGSGCLLALGDNEVSGTGSGIYVNGGGSTPATIGPTTCESIANASGPMAVYVQASTSTIAGSVTTSGSAFTANGGTITGVVKTHQPATPDPYLGLQTLTRTGFGLSNSYTASGPFACAGEWFDPNSSTNSSPILNGNGVAGSPGVNTQNNLVAGAAQRLNGGQFQWNAVDSSWHFSQSQANFCQGCHRSYTYVFKLATLGLGSVKLTARSLAPLI